MHHTIVIGGGQAGLAMGYFLKRSGFEFVIIDKGTQIGESWKNRYDSLMLFSPKVFSSLPGLNLEGNKHDFPSKDEVADYLKLYAAEFDLPIQLNTEVKKITKEHGVFNVFTDREVLQCENIVVATGPFQKKSIPSFTQKLNSSVLQLHSSEYKNPQQLQDGNVLVVGGGNSGAQIAVELSSTKETYLAVSKPIKSFPMTVAGKSTFWWFDKLGIYKKDSHSIIGKKLRLNGDPIFGRELPTSISKKKIHLKSRVMDCSDNRIIFEDSSSLEIQNVIWATGFKMDYSWIDIQEALDGNGEIIHNRGLSPVKGLYFLGLPWQTNRGSALLLGVGNDASYLSNKLI